MLSLTNAETFVHIAWHKPTAALIDSLRKLPKEQFNAIPFLYDG